jgi:hypothetical protein
LGGAMKLQSATPIAPAMKIVKEAEIGQPINSEECSETADGVARESESRGRLPTTCTSRRTGLSISPSCVVV